MKKNAPSLHKNTNIERFLTLCGATFLIIVISFSLYSVIKKYQQTQLHSTANDVIEKTISSITKNWDYNDAKTLFSTALREQADNSSNNNNSNIFKNFSRLGKLTLNSKPVLLDYNPAPDYDSLAVTVSYKIVAVFQNGHATFLVNLTSNSDASMIDFINIDAVYNINTPFSTETDELV